MAEVVPIEALGTAPVSFHLPPAVPELETLQYYLIVESHSHAYINQAGYWDIVAVGTLPRNPHGVLLRQIHIEEEMLDWPQFDAWTDSTGSFALTPSETAAFRDWALDLARRLPETEYDAADHIYFAPVPVDAYTKCGIPAGLVERFRPLLERDARLYRFHPDTTLTLAPGYRFLRLSDWTTTNPLSATAGFCLETYTLTRVAEIRDAYAEYLRQRASRPYLPADMLDGESQLEFSAGALRALAQLLDEHLATIGWGAASDEPPGG